MNHPYAAPNAKLEQDDEVEFYDARMFALSGRIGRLRYFGYVMAMWWLVGILSAGIQMLVRSLLPPEAAVGVFLVIFYAILLSGSLVLARRRLHDMGLSGWLVLLILVPFVNFALGLMLLFKRGDEGHNRFGPPAKAGSWWWLLLALSIPLIGIVAAIALPAYQDYVHKAKAHNAEIIEKQRQRDAERNAN